MIWNGLRVITGRGVGRHDYSRKSNETDENREECEIGGVVQAGHGGREEEKKEVREKNKEEKGERKECGR